MKRFLRILGKVAKTVGIGFAIAAAIAFSLFAGLGMFVFFLLVHQ